MLPVMKLATLALLTLLAAPARAYASAAARDAYTELPPGRYSMGVSGMVSVVCARAIKVEWEKLPGVDKAVVDFDKESAIVSVRLDKTLRVAALRKTLRKAERLANLGARYDLSDIKYLP